MVDEQCAFLYSDCVVSSGTNRRMSRIVDAVPFVEDAPAPPLPVAEVSVEQAMATVEAATRAARERIEREAAATPIDDPNIIRVRPRLGEMNALDALREARPYVASAALVAAALVVLYWLLQMRVRYRRANVPERPTPRAVDRRSVTRERRRASNVRDKSE